MEEKKVTVHKKTFVGIASTLGAEYLFTSNRPKPNLGYTVEARTEPKIGRNEPCPCNSGKKYKKCCLI